MPSRWRIAPEELPRVGRWCGRCARQRAFHPSGRFRINANRRRIDVWLPYRCASCELSWKLPLLRRAAPESIPRAELEAFWRNDAEAAHRYASDGARIEAAGARLLLARGVRVERLGDREKGWVQLEVSGPGLPRLDRLLASVLGLSRTAVRRAFVQGRLRLAEGGLERLKRPPRDGDMLYIDPELRAREGGVACDSHGEDALPAPGAAKT